MKKELVLASLMLTSPAVLAQTPSSQNNLVATDQHSNIGKAKWIFEANDYIRLPRYDYDKDSGEVEFSHNDVVKTSVHFFPVNSQSDLFDFTLNDFDPLKEGEEEFEVSFRTQNLSDNLTYFESSNTYYGIKKDETVFLYDCDSTKRCDAGKESKSLAVIKFKKNGEMRFEHTADYFFTPYITQDQNNVALKDLGAKMKYTLKK